MIIDPHVAVISVSAERGPTLYEGVMHRVAERREQPRGVMLHFTTFWRGSFIVGTVFQDPATMLDGFIGFSAREAQNEMVATGRPLDMSRSEFRLERLFVEPDVEAQPFSYVPADGVIAFVGEGILPKIETFRAIGQNRGYFDAPAEGRIAHIAHSSPGGVRSMTFWKSRELGERWHQEHLYGPLNELEPGKLTPEVLDASWLDLKTFLVAVGPDDRTRNFVRESPGPSDA